jgi:hypothetical protein
VTLVNDACMCGDEDVVSTLVDQVDPDTIAAGLDAAAGLYEESG